MPAERLVSVAALAAVSFFVREETAPKLVAPPDCDCTSTTVPVNPNLNGGTWSVTGTIAVDPLITDRNGRCLKAGCQPPPEKSCKHPLNVNITVTFPTAAVPPPSGSVKITSLSGETATFGLSPTGVTIVGANTVYSYVFNITLESPCKAGTTDPTGGSFSLEWTPPGGGAATSSGSVATTCGGCG